MSAVLDQFRRHVAGLPDWGGQPQGEEAGAPAAVPARWSWAALGGRLVELSADGSVDGGTALLTPAGALVGEAQREGEPTAWVTEAGSSFYPPDLAALGIDLEALAVVRVPEWQAVARAGERLARSGAFGLIVLDLGRRARIAPPLQGRLAMQALRHGTAILCLTEKSERAASLGSLISLHARITRRRRGEDRFATVLTATKDKRRGPGWVHEEEWHGPPGLR